MKTRFVSYYRVSTGKQGLRGNGMEVQKQIVRRYLAAVDCPLVASFEEVESGDEQMRPQLQAAILRAKAEKAALIVAKLDRLSRDPEFLLRLQQSGVEFVACDLPNAEKLSIGMIALLAQRERDLISERTKASLAVARARGVVLGNPHPAKALGKARQAIQRRKLEFAESALKNIREIQTTGVFSLNRIADCLNKRGEPTRRNGKWTATAVKRVLAASSER